MVRSELGRRVAALCLVGLTLQVAPMGAVLGLAHAASKPTVAIVPLTPLEGVSPDAARKVSDALVSELASRQGQLTLLGVPASTRKAAGAGADAQVKALFDEGRARLGDLDFEAAANALRRGLVLARADAAHVDLPSILEAQVSLAVALFRKGEEQEAQDSLLTVVRLAPSYALAEGRYPPIFVREFETARKRALKLPTGTVLIEGPRGATAFVDGRDLGMVPLEEEGLRQGTHWIQVVGAKGERFGQFIDIGKGVTKVKAQFGAAPAASQPLHALPQTLDAGELLKLQTLAKNLGAEVLVVGVVQRVGESHRVGLALYSRAEHALRTLEPVSLNSKLEELSGTAYLLAGTVSERVGTRGAAEPLPVTLLPIARAAVVSRPNDRPVKEHVLLQPGSGELRKLDRPSVLDPAAPGGASASSSHGANASAGIPWWVWVAGGMGVAAVAGGTAYGLSQAARPVTGTVTARW